MATLQEIIKTLGIPKSTIYDWNSRERTDWRYKLISSLVALDQNELKVFQLKGFMNTYQDMNKLKESILDTLDSFDSILNEDKYQELLTLASTIGEDKPTQYNYEVMNKIESEILSVWDGDWFGF